ncbi:TRAP transporter small permease [Stella sp.]|uniref:TRAP transporter small permease n=1 Tax=Stella sp. TaxID=2912054 RepID=UPI0035B3D199
MNGAAGGAAGTLLGRADRAIAAAERVWRLAGSAALAAIMLIVATDVLLRYLLNAPLSWAFDLISLYLMAGLFFLALSDTQRHHGHVAVDIFQYRLSDRMRHLCQCLVHASAAVVFAIIFALGAGRARDAYLAGDVLEGAIAWPTWIAAALVPLGVGLLLLRLLLSAVAHGLAALTGRPTIDLPPLSGSDEAV